ncbi:MAG: cobalamin-binding protein [Desulfarculaceae bacterium]|jgi:iron complex transport system substrate-binding protein
MRYASKLGVKAMVLSALTAWAFALAGPGLTEAAVVKDEMGRKVEAPARPLRIVALTPSLVEILFALGLQERIVGATTWADYPPQARAIARVGSYVSPNIERIVELAPDLVLANREGNPPAVVKKLTRAGIPVYVTWPTDPARLPQSLQRLGMLCGAAAQGDILAAKMRAQFALVRKNLQGAAPVPTLMVIGSRPLVTASPQTFNGRLLAMAGAKNIAPDGAGKWPRLSMEYVVQALPDLVIISTMERGQNLDKELAYWRGSPGLKQNKRYRVVSIESNLIDRPGPRLGRGLIKLARLIHPRRMHVADSQP